MARGEEDDVAETIREQSITGLMAKAGSGTGGEDTPSLADKAKTRPTRKIVLIAGTISPARVGERSRSCFYAVAVTPSTTFGVEYS